MAEKRKDSKGRILRTGESQRPDGRYCYKYIDAGGKQQFIYSWKLEPTDRIPKGKRDGPALREKEKEVQRDRLDGIDHSGGSMTVSDLYSKHIRLQPNVARNTEASRARRLKMLAKDPLGDCRISSVKPADAKAWALRMKEKGVAYKTISGDKSALKAAFATALENDYVRKNPFDFVLSKVIKNDTKRKEALTPAQEAALRDFMRNDKTYRKYYDEIVILLGTGLRISELCGLTVNDIDFSENKISIDHQLLESMETGLYVDTPKSKNGFREIPMGTEVSQAIWRVMQRPKAEKPVEINGLSGFLFRRENGQPMTAHIYEAMFRRLKRKYAKQKREPLPENLSPHTLRHTFCTRMANSGMKPKALQYIMGHYSITLTLDYYADSDGEAAAAEMKRVLAG